MITGSTAMVARLWVPLRDPLDVPDDRAERTSERLRLLADAYGLPQRERRVLVEAAGETHAWCYDIVRDGAEQGWPGYVHYWTASAQEHAERGRRWLASNAECLGSALS